MDTMEDQTVVEYFVAATLNKGSKAFEWSPEGHDESIQHNGNKMARPRHTLSLKRAILGADAKEGELNLIEMHTKGLDGEDIRVPLAYLQTGTMYQTPLDLTLPENVVTLSLVKGEGPVHVLGQHIVTAPALEDMDEDVDEEEEAAEDDETEEDYKAALLTGGKAKDEVNEKKRKNESDPNGDVKKAKLVASNTTNGPTKEDGAEAIEVDAPAAEAK